MSVTEAAFRTEMPDEVQRRTAKRRSALVF